MRDLHEGAPLRFNSALVSTFIFVLGCSTTPTSPKSDALWNIINTKCVPPVTELSPNCIEVNVENGRDKGYVIFKDRVGELQYLLMPTRKITGMESPEIISPDAPNYFYLAWKYRTYMEKKKGSAIPVEAMSLAINSQFGRSQNQLHIHISCPKPEVQAQVQKLASSLRSVWSIVPEKIEGHQYYAKILSEKELQDTNAFADLEGGVPEAKNNLAEFGMGLIAVKNKKNQTQLVLLSSRRNTLTRNRGSVEEIQNHDCPQLN